ncbi:hypothetical protein CJF42_25570 [Pseudoalteromonas sp. NBT06-2]|uniref:hypothetical protein n=1 Tax=Pseudoalteromonas sp. NBT06-2 TaxID=2025950 RepID=UPI000BA799D3|nr:hypothetical protein [Pseudoalteromonas sp. NBT06-2]PAJ71653.1 hypothetical protein CJF42_25570 [Pseudoalteromonas sp. NBT06-2]
MKKIILLVLGVFLAGCLTTGDNPPLHFYSGNKIPTAELGSILSFTNIVVDGVENPSANLIQSINGKSVGYDSQIIYLKPGKHKIEYSFKYVLAWSFSSSTSAGASEIIDLTVKKGKRYKIQPQIDSEKEIVNWNISEI